ncbi:MAG: hypothetical protein ACREJQ_06215 [bacterium]
MKGFVGVAAGLVMAGHVTMAKQGGPIMAPTAVGSYAMYHCVTRAEVGFGLVISHTADVRVAIVGSEPRDVETTVFVQSPDGGSEPAKANIRVDYLWLEFDVMTDGEKPLKAKVLIAKSALTALPLTPVEDWSPYLHLPESVDSIVVQRGDDTPKSLPIDKPDLSEIPEWPMISMWLGQFMKMNVEEGDPDTLLVQAGKFDTRYFTVHANAWLPEIAKAMMGDKVKDVNARANASMQVWATDKVPFGIVKATRSLDANFRGPKMKETRHITANGAMTLIGFGNDAHSMIMGTPEPIDFDHHGHM